jgi:hypothetical protein
VLFRSCRYTSRVIMVAVVGIALCPTICRAQEATLPVSAWPPVLSSLPPSLPLAYDAVSARDRIEPQHVSVSDVVDAKASRLGVFLPMYLSFASLQSLDAHSTILALRAGGREQNPLMRDLANRPAGLVALKAGVTASTILLTERLRSKHRVGAMVLMTALNSAYAMVVVHNYRALP